MIQCILENKTDLSYLLPYTKHLNSMWRSNACKRFRWSLDVPHTIASRYPNSITSKHWIESTQNTDSNSTSHANAWNWTRSSINHTHLFCTPIESLWNKVHTKRQNYVPSQLARLKKIPKTFILCEHWKKHPNSKFQRCDTLHLLNIPHWYIFTHTNSLMQNLLLSPKQRIIK